MQFGSGTLRGWSVTPAARESREQTARGAILKLAWLLGEGRREEAETILRDHGERIAAAVLAEVDRLKPLAQPTPAQVAEVARRVQPSPPVRGPIDVLPRETYEVKEELAEAFDEALDAAPPVQPREVPPLAPGGCYRLRHEAGVSIAKAAAALGWTSGMIQAVETGKDPSRLAELSAYVRTLPGKDPREERRKWLTEVAEREGPGLWLELAKQEAVTPSDGAWCALCAKDVHADAVTRRFDSLDFWVHRQCALTAAHDAARDGRVPKPDLPPSGLSPDQERRWELATVALLSEIKPKAYRGDVPLPCELCVRPIAKGAPSRRKRPKGYPNPESKASSKFMHAECVDSVLANPSQPLLLQEETHA